MQTIATHTLHNVYHTDVHIDTNTHRHTCVLSSNTSFCVPFPATFFAPASPAPRMPGFVVGTTAFAATGFEDLVPTTGVTSLLFGALAASAGLGLVEMVAQDIVDADVSTEGAILAFLPWDSFCDI